MIDEVFEALQCGAFSHFDTVEFSVYCVLRADVYLTESKIAEMKRGAGKLCSAHTVQSIAQKISISENSVKRGLENLLRRGAVRKERVSDKDFLYHLGNLEDKTKVSWFVEKPVRAVREPERPWKKRLRDLAEESRTRIKQRKKEKTSKLSAETKRQIAVDLMPTSAVRKKGASFRIIEAWHKEYLRAFKKHYSHKGTRSAKMQLISMASKALKLHGENEEKLVKRVNFILQNWDLIQNALGGEKGEPKFNLICSKKFLAVIERFEEKGIPKKEASLHEGIAKRVDKDKLKESQDEGW